MEVQAKEEDKKSEELAEKICSQFQLTERFGISPRELILTFKCFIGVLVFILLLYIGRKVFRKSSTTTTAEISRASVSAVKRFKSV